MTLLQIHQQNILGGRNASGSPAAKPKSKMTKTTGIKMRQDFCTKMFAYE
jgi:hypothetical protein